MQQRQLVVGHLQLHAAGLAAADRLDRLPVEQVRLHPARKPLGQARQAQPPHDGAAGNIDADHPQAAVGAGQLQVVDADELVPLGVDDLLVEDVAGQEDLALLRLDRLQFGRRQAQHGLGFLEIADQLPGQQHLFGGRS